MLEAVLLFKFTWFCKSVAFILSHKSDILSIFKERTTCITEDLQMVLTSDMKISSFLLANIVYLCRALRFWFHNSWNQTQKKLTSKFKVCTRQCHL